MLTRDFQSKLQRLTLGFWCSKEELEQLAEEALQKPQRVKKLFGLIFHETPLVQAQAARALFIVAAKKPACLQPYKDLLIQEVTEDKHWIVRVSFCRIIPQLKLKARDVNQAMKILMGYLDDESSVVKTCAMQGLFDLTLLDANLRDDILPIIESLTHTGTPAMRARGRQLQKKLYKTDKRRKV